MIVLLLACAADPAPAPTADDTAPSAAPAPGPRPGDYDVEVAETWEGDCTFADPATYASPTQRWTLDPRGEVLVVYRDYWTPLACTLDGVAFTCDDGSWSADRMQVTLLLEGTATAEGTLSGARVIELDCGGAGCDTLKDLYGGRLDFPCRSEAPFTGTAVD